MCAIIVIRFCLALTLLSAISGQLHTVGFGFVRFRKDYVTKLENLLLARSSADRQTSTTTDLFYEEYPSGRLEEILKETSYL
ncbi:hypothetical protein L596_020971 [Steinernema carpocapsae]|uniref:Uncharacterized protein n=1 Tax=Steinernema carpocapsae TaxID=34508 RepID=A0A4U5MVA9_STECR|nr:hypothetical protein L596_020971 [Steinernema carpocapsae]